MNFRPRGRLFNNFFQKTGRMICRCKQEVNVLPVIFIFYKLNQDFNCGKKIFLIIIRYAK